MRPWCTAVLIPKVDADTALAQRAERSRISSKSGCGKHVTHGFIGLLRKLRAPALCRRKVWKRPEAPENRREGPPTPPVARTQVRIEVVLHGFVDLGSRQQHCKLSAPAINVLPRNNSRGVSNTCTYLATSARDQFNTGVSDPSASCVVPAAGYPARAGSCCARPRTSG